MPLRQVYGKKRTARNHRDAHAVFGSPRSDKSPLEVKVVKVFEEPAAINLSDESITVNEGAVKKSRGALREVHQNSVRGPEERLFINACDTFGDEKPHRRRRRREVIIEDSEHDDGKCYSIHPCGTTTTRQDPVATIPRNDDEIKDELLVTRPHDRTYTSTDLEPTNEFILHCTSLLTLSSHSLTAFSSWTSQLAAHFNLNKIAEASFGEVYRLSLLHSLPGFNSTDESVLKIIPLRPPPSTCPMERRKRLAWNKRVADMSLPVHVANEVELLQRMTSIPGFTNFRDVRIVQGRPPKVFQDAWKKFHLDRKARGREGSVFPNPAKKNSYDENQLWAVIEMQDAGIDLEQLLEEDKMDSTEDLTSIFSIWDVFWQVALSLGKGEEGAGFEHRDLHLGNICVRKSPLPTPSDTADEIIKRKLHFTRNETTIIDYTISRAELCDDRIAFHDLASPENATLFTADGSLEYQYDIYRYMRALVYQGNAYADISSSRSPDNSKSKWQDFNPITNLVWLHYVLHKLLGHATLPSTEPSVPRRLKEKHALWKRGVDLEHVLFKVSELLDPVRLSGKRGIEDQDDTRLTSVTELIALALREGWLDVEDVVGDGEALDDEGESDVIDSETEGGKQDGLVESLAALQLHSSHDKSKSENNGAEKLDYPTRGRPKRRKD